MNKWVIFDMDSTLANISDRRSLATVSGKMDYSVLFDSKLITLDKPNSKVINLLNSLRDFGCKVFILTARPDTNLEATIRWLREQNVGWDYLKCKPHHKRFLKSNDWKEAELHTFCLDRGISPEQVVLSVDDDVRNIQMFEGYGIPCLDPHYQEDYSI